MQAHCCLVITKSNIIPIIIIIIEKISYERHVYESVDDRSLSEGYISLMQNRIHATRNKIFMTIVIKRADIGIHYLIKQ